MPDRHPTARRLIEDGLRLFAEVGVAGTPIVRIEEAAGLAPGSGAFYRHFRSKAELLAAAVADAATATQFGIDQLAVAERLPFEDQPVFIARGAWLMFDAHRDLLLVLTRERGPRPAGYGHGPDDWPGSGVPFVSSWLRARVASGDLAPVEDPDATALVLLDTLWAYWLQREAEGPTPYGIDDTRFIAAWTDLVLRLRHP